MIDPIAAQVLVNLLDDVVADEADRLNHPLTHHCEQILIMMSQNGIKVQYEGLERFEAVENFINEL